MTIRHRTSKLAAALAVVALLVATLAVWPGSERADASTTPSGVDVFVTGETSATVAWQAVADVKDYRVQYAASDEDYKGWSNLDWNKFPTGTTVDLTNLEAGTEYKVRVRARFQGSPSSPWSAELLFETHEEEETVVARSHDTGTVAITYHGHGDNASARPTNVAVVRRDHKDVHITWTRPTTLAFGNYHLYRRWSGADTGGVKCIHLQLGPSRTSYTDTTVASYHPGGGESTYEYRLYTRPGGNFSCGGGWPNNGAFGYVKIVVPVNHHEDVYAATDTGTVVHNDPPVPSITRLTAGGRSDGAVHGSYILVEWNAIPYAPGYRVQYKKSSEADTEWKETYQFRMIEGSSASEFDNCTGDPDWSNDSQGERAEERGVGTRVADFQSVCRRSNYPTGQVADPWPVYWGADGEDRIRYAPTRFRLQRVAAATRYDIRVAMCTELEVDATIRPLPVCAAVGDYSATRSITSAP